MTFALVILSALAAPPSGGSGSAVGAGMLPADEVFVCDFEDSVDPDFDAWPDGWTRQRSRQLPEFLRVGIVAENPKNRCFSMQLDGGGAMAASPHFLVSPQFSLLLTLRIKTAGLVHDGAWATLTLQDAGGNVLEQHSSQPLTKSSDWQNVRIGPITAADNRVARGNISLHLSPLNKQEDLKGQAWFDDLRVVRLPRMTLTTAHAPTSVYANRELAEMACEVSGICVPNPQVRFELFDHTGRCLAEHNLPLLSSQEIARYTGDQLPKNGYAGHAKWVPPLPDHGFYRVRAVLYEKGKSEALLDRVQSLAVLRPLPTARGTFGWNLSGQEEPFAFGPLTGLLSQAALGYVKMPVWYDARETARADRIAWFAEQLSIQGMDLVGVLDQPPPELRQVFREQGRLPMVTVFAEPELWQPAVSPVMTRLSLKVRTWQLGDDSDVSFIGYPQLDNKIAEIKKHLEQYGQQVQLAINWRIGYSPPVAPPKGAPWSCLSYGIDPPLTAEEINSYFQPGEASEHSPEKRQRASGETRGVAASSATKSVTAVAPAARRELASSGRAPAGKRPAPTLNRWMQLAPLPKGEYAMESRVQDLVMRMLSAKMRGIDAVFVPQPFSDEAGVMNSDGSPGELFVPWRTTAALIGGAEYLGPLQLPGGSTSHVFAHNGRALMAVWSDRPTSEFMFLGDEVEQIDVWGRGHAPPLVERDGLSVHALSIGVMPTFVTGLSEAVARWQSAVKFESTQLSSVAGRQQIIVLCLPNTFPQAVGGDFTLHAPKSWDVDSRPTRFKIAEGEVLRLPLPVTLKADANSGPQPIRLDFDVSAQGSNRFSVYRTLQLGLDDVQVELTSRLKEDVLEVKQLLTNLSDNPLSFNCVLFARGRRRETQQVLQLGRDSTTLTFVLPRGEELIGEKLWLRAEEIGGPRVLNYTLTAEP